jgi:hypothetical protein
MRDASRRHTALRFANTVRGLGVQKSTSPQSELVFRFPAAFELRAFKLMFVTAAARLAKIHGLILKTVP